MRYNSVNDPYLITLPAGQIDSHNLTSFHVVEETSSEGLESMTKKTNAVIKMLKTDPLDYTCAGFLH